MKKRLDSFMKMVICYQEFEFKELTEKAMRENVM